MASYFVIRFDPKLPDETWTALAEVDKPFVGEYLARELRETDLGGNVIWDCFVISERDLLRKWGRLAVETARSQVSISDALDLLAGKASLEPLLAVHRARVRSERASLHLHRSIKRALDSRFTLQEVAQYAGMSHENVRKVGSDDKPAVLIKPMSSVVDEAREYLASIITIPHGIAPIDAAMGGGARHRQLALMFSKSWGGSDELMIHSVLSAVKAGRKVVIASLESTRVYMLLRIARALFGIDHAEATELLGSSTDPRIKALEAVMEHVAIVDGLQDDGSYASLTVPELQAIIEQTSQASFGDDADAVYLDHLSLLRIGDMAPKSIKDDTDEAQAHLVQELAKAVRALGCYMMVNVLVRKEIPSGKHFSYEHRGAARSSKTTDYADYIYTVWREEDHEDGPQIVIDLQKNRHGSPARAQASYDDGGRLTRIQPHAIAMSG